MLYTYEELFLLALNEERGVIQPFAKKVLSYGLSGAILADLALLGKISSNEKQRVEILNADPTGDEILDESLKEIKASDKPRQLSYWVTTLGGKSPKKLRQRFGEHLATKQILVQEDGHFYWKQPAVEDDQQLTPSKFDLKETLRAVVLVDGAADICNLALLNVASGSELLDLIFTRDELDIARRNIHEKVLRVALENHPFQTIEEIEQAISTTIEDEVD
jgi:golgi phosphoprotein 3